MEPKPPFISRVVLKNYKSIASCDVRLGTLQFLVGRNGSGKSNFLDALAFVRDALIFNDVKSAVYQRANLLHHSGSGKEQPHTFGMRLEFNLPDGATGSFAFEIAKDNTADNLVYKVVHEECIIDEGRSSPFVYEIRDGKIQDKNPERFPPVSDDRLYLQNMSAVPGFRRLYDALLSMRFYSIDPTIMALMHDRQPQKMSVDADISTVLESSSPEVKDRTVQYLRHIVPSVSDFEVRKMKDLRFLYFKMATDPKDSSWHLFAASMSDGTLRALGVLTALLQERKNGGNNFPALVCIEEPETGLHSRAIGALLGAMQEASDMRQVLVATHSTDMLDNEDITPDQISPVEMQKLASLIAPMGDITKSILHDHLATAGELLRQDMLPPNDGIFPEEAPSLFSDE